MKSMLCINCIAGHSLYATKGKGRLFKEDVENSRVQFARFVSCK